MKNFQSVVFLSCVFFLFSCSENKNPLKPISDNFIYPLKAGHKWQYSKTYTRQNFIPVDSTITENVPDRSWTSDLSVEITKEETIDNNINTFVFLEQEGPGEGADAYYSYRNNLEDGFYEFAGHSILFKRLQKEGIISTKGNPFSINQNIFKSKIDSLNLHTKPILLLEYPLKINSQWTSEESADFSRIDKKVISKENIKTEIGSYECLKIEWLFYENGKLNDKVSQFDYICSDGLIKRINIVREVPFSIMNGTRPQTIGTIDIEAQLLISTINF